MALLTVESVREAAARLSGVAHRTPILRSRTLDDRCGGSVVLKCENLQRSGSFKFRGAFNAVSTLTAEERDRGILSYSSGNHTQALALAGRVAGVRVTVVMPTSAPLAKLEATRGYGAEVILYDPEVEVREEVAGRILEESGSVLIPPFDHPAVIAGQGTAALELFEDVGPLDLLFVPCGGGGLLSGSALVAKSVEGCRIVGVEPEMADDATRTFRTGTLQTVRNPPTVADGLRTPSLGALTWPLVRENVSEMVTVPERDIVQAMRFLWERMKIVVEPSGATALAGLLGYRELAGRKVGVVVSGGNVDLATACSLFAPAEQPSTAQREREQHVERSTGLRDE